MPSTTTEQFEHHAAKAFFASAWADAAEEAENGPNLSGREIMDEMPDEIDPAAIHAARTLRMNIESENEGRDIEVLLAFIVGFGKGDRPNTVEMFGHYAAMQAMGHGVDLRDAFGRNVHESIAVPDIEFSQLDLEKDYF